MKLAVLSLVTVIGAVWQLRREWTAPDPTVMPTLPKPRMAAVAYKAPPPPPVLAIAPPVRAVDELEVVAAALDEEHANVHTFADRSSVLDPIIDQSEPPNWISGHVRDQDRELLVGATVIAQHPTLGSRAVITEEDGSYQMSEVDPRDGWTLTVYYGDAKETEWNTRWFSRHDSVEITVDTSDRAPSSTPSCVF